MTYAYKSVYLHGRTANLTRDLVEKFWTVSKANGQSPIALLDDFMATYLSKVQNDPDYEAKVRKEIKEEAAIKWQLALGKEYPREEIEEILTGKRNKPQTLVGLQHTYLERLLRNECPICLDPPVWTPDGKPDISKSHATLLKNNGCCDSCLDRQDLEWILPPSLIEAWKEELNARKPKA